MSFDPITLALAKSYTDDQRLGYIEQGEVILSAKLNDGWAEGEDGLGLVLGETYVVTIDDEVFEVVCVEGGGSLDLEVLEGRVMDVDYFWMIDGFNEHPNATITVSTGGTVHKIDKRLIPAMDYLILNAPDGKPFKVTVDINGKLVVEKI